MGLKGVKGRGAKYRPPIAIKHARVLEALAAEYPETCGPKHDPAREEEAFLVDLYLSNDVQLGAAGVRRYTAANTTAAARLDAAPAVLPRSSRERGDAERAAAEAAVLVSVVVPTTAKRATFHGMLYSCFASQTHPSLELLILDTGAAPSPFFTSDAAVRKDRRVRYSHSEEDAPTGAKRNALIEKARGQVIVQFDDDDVYTPRYVERILSAMKGSNASVCKLSAWKWFDAARAAQGGSKILHYYDNEVDKATGYDRSSTAAGWHSRKWGYGFSFAFDRDAALECPFPPTFLGEDYDFIMLLRDRGYTMAAFSDDPDSSIVLHVLHNNNSSVVAKHRTFDLADLDASFEAPIGATIAAMRKSGAYDTELSTYVSAARKARYEEGEFK